MRARVDFYATGQGEDRVWRQTRPQARDLAVSILLDVSRSTESAVPGHGHDGRTVIGVEREALAALAWGLECLRRRFRDPRVFLAETQPGVCARAARILPSR